MHCSIRRHACVLAAAFACLWPCVTFAAADPLAGLTLRQKLAQLLVVRFRGPDYSDDLDRMLRADGAGAVVLYAVDGNLVDEAQVRGLTAKIRQANAIPPMVGVDQEGGRVDRLAAIRGKHPAATAIGDGGDPARAAAEGAADARDLARYGIQLNLAPVVDVAQVYNWQLDQRTWGRTPEAVTTMAGAYLAALQAGDRVVGTLKHFPGLGGVTEDPHREVPRLPERRDGLEGFDWVPYRELIRRGDAHAVMVTHVFVESIDAAHPASLSPAIVTGALRGALGFDGVVIADALTMKGIASDDAIGDVALQALLAGCDWLMGPSSAGDVEAIVDRFERAVAANVLTVERVDASVRRVLALKRRVGLLAAGTP